MPSVKFKDTQSVGEMTNTIEYEFAEYSDFKDWQASQREAMQESVKNMVEQVMGQEDFEGTLYGENPFENELADNVTEIKVSKKKRSEPTKH